MDKHLVSHVWGENVKRVQRTIKPHVLYHRDMRNRYMYTLSISATTLAIYLSPIGEDIKRPDEDFGKDPIWM